MLQLTSLILILLTLHLQICSASFWLIRNYFYHCNIQFVELSENFRHVEDPPPYFYDVLTKNPTSPVIFNQIEMTNTTKKREVGSVGSQHGRSGRLYIVVLHISGARSMSSRKIFYRLHQTILRNFNPNYIFQHTDDPWNSINVKYYFDHLGSSKLTIFSTSLPRKIFIPCLTCLPSRIVGMSTIPINELEVVWWSENNNLRQQIVELWDDGDLNETNCGVNYVPHKNTWPSFCKIVHLYQNLNFTSVRNERFPVSVLAMWQSLYKTIHILIRNPWFYSPFSVEFEYVKFSVITQYPNALQGMNAYLLPFSVPVWVGLLVSCVTLCLIAQVQNYTTSAFEIMRKICLNIFKAAAILLGQINSSNLNIFNRRSFGAPILMVWLFCGRYIIMDNLYTGSIFSYLSAIKPPIVPETLTELVESNIPIVSTSSLTSQESILKKVIIPNYVDNLKIANKSIELLQKLVSKIVFVNAYSAYVKFFKNILTLDLLTYFNTSIDTSRTYAIIDADAEFSIFTDLLKANGRRLVINGQGDMPFVYVSTSFGLRNCFHQLFSRKLSQLAASGIEARWPKVRQIGNSVHVLRGVWGDDYKTHLSKYMSGSKRSNKSLSKEGPITLKTVETIFVLCSILQIFAFISFIIERRKVVSYFLKYIVN